jgi:hypothetical protein
MKKYILILIFCGAISTSCNQTKKEVEIQQWDVFEIELNGPNEGTPFIDVELNVTFI